MSHLYKIAILLAMLPLLIQCDNDKGFPEAAYPRIITLPVTNVGPTGAAFHARTAQAGTDEVVNRGFVWGLDAGVTALNGERIDVGPGAGDFDATVSFGLVKGQTYYVKAFAATGSMLAYGPVVEFVSDGSLPPVITGFSPTTASWRDTVTITGSGFSYINGNNVVKFGEVSASVIKSTESSIQCTVPTSVAGTAVRITVKVGTGEAQSADYFTVIPPMIESISPAAGTFGDEVTITGTRFGSSLYDNVVTFDTHVAELVSASANKLVVKVPSSIRKRENVISVTTRNVTTAASTPFSILAPEVTNISVTKAKMGELLTISGKNFNSEPDATTVTIGGNAATVQSVSAVSVTVTVPWGTYPGRSIFPEVTVAEQSVFSTQALELQDPWFQKAESPGSAYGRSSGVVFAVNGSAYVGLGVDQDSRFWRYIPATDKWSEVAPFPGGDRSGAVSFVIGNFGYVGLGNNGERDFWRFDPAANHWTRIADFPNSSSQSVAFAANGSGYVAISDESDNFWAYNPATDNWTTKLDHPGTASPHTYPASGFALGNDLYVFSSDHTYRYNAVSNTWAAVAFPDYNGTSIGSTGFSVNGEGYIRTERQLLKYSPATNSWQVNGDNDMLGYRRFPLAVEINGKVYFGCGDYRYDWWEYDPAFE